MHARDSFWVASITSGIRRGQIRGQRNIVTENQTKSGGVGMVDVIR